MRILERLDELYAIGGGPGANRPHRTPAEDEAHQLAADVARERPGSTSRSTASGNLFGHAAGRHRTSWVGLASRHRAAGRPLRRRARRRRRDRGRRARGRGSVVVFRGEEVGCIGSRALVAAGAAASACVPRAARRAGPGARERRGSARRRDRHRRLRARRARVRRTSRPRGDHADDGRATTRSSPRRRRSCAIRDAALAIEGAVATVGQVDVEPGGANVIPSRVRMSRSTRGHPTPSGWTRCSRRSGSSRATASSRRSSRSAAPSVARRDRGARPARVELPSGAGHDAGILASRASTRRCCSSAASTAASATRRTSCRPTRTSRSGSTCCRTRSRATTR